MASYTSSNTDEEDLALALRLSQLSSDAFDENISRLYHTRSASASPVTLPSTPRSDESNLALTSQRSHAAEEQGQSIASNRSALSGSNAHQTAPQHEFDDTNRAHIVRATS